jgi:NAD(P)-dependent dehydrogenase (short-subunit alcohol dehydrogenase family)
MSQGKLTGRVTVVTGGGSGIGREIALLFARHGARVAIFDVDDAGGAATAAAATAEGGEAIYSRCDVSRQAEVVDAFGAVAAELGPVDILVNNAGISHVGTVETTKEEDFDRVYAVNVKGVYNCLKSAVDMMKGRGGVILNLASVASMVGVPDRFAYGMSKGAVLTMTYSVATDYVRQGIRCNSISPGRVHTPFVDGFIARNYPGREAEMFDTLSRTQPLGRMGRPEEIAALALFLCSDEAAFITGSNFPIDGGFVNLKI